MIRNILLLLMLFGAAIAYTVYSERIVPAPAQTHLVAPAFTFETVDGKKHSLSYFKHKTVVLNFWASWCAPCVIEFPQMIRLADMTKEESVFIFMSIDDEKADIKKFLKKYDVKTDNIIIGHDRTKAISRDLFKTYKIPETYIIAPDGRIADKITGADIIWDSPEMAQKIKSLKK